MNNKSELALYGGDPIRTGEFSSKPMVDDQEIDLVIELMKNNQFSKFVGSPVAGTYEILHNKSEELLVNNISPNFLGGEYVRKLEA